MKQKTTPAPVKDAPTVDKFLQALANNETPGEKDPYKALGKITKGNRAIGKYQVMPQYVPDWTQEYLGKKMTPEQFKSDPQAQEVLMRKRAESLYKKYGNWADVASVHFSGRPVAKAGDAKDVNGTSVPTYVKKIMEFLGGGVAYAETAPSENGSTKPRYTAEQIIEKFGKKPIATSTDAAVDPKRMTLEQVIALHGKKPDQQSKAGVQPKSDSPAANPFAGALGSMVKPQVPTQKPANAFGSMIPVDKTGKQSETLVKGVADFAISSEKAAGQDIAGALPDAMTGQKMAQQSRDELAQAQGKVLAKIKENKAAGKDSSKLLKELDSTTRGVPTSADINPAIKKSGLEIVGDFAGVAADVASAGTYGAAKTAGMKTGEIAVKGVPSTISAANKGLGMLAKRSSAKTMSKIIEAVSPKLTAKETAEAIAKQGTKKAGMLRRTVLNASKESRDIAETVQKLVPDFKPGRSLVENVNKVRSAVSAMASDLKKAVIDSGKDRIYSLKELGSRLRSIEEPISLRGTPFEKQIGPLKDAVMKMAREKGGKVSTLLDLRQEFDALVNKTWPNLWDAESAPMRNAVRSIRDELTNFTEKNLPDEVKLKESLTNQSKLIRAIENMSEKAASGAEKEIGTTPFGRATSAIKKHPFAAGIGTVIGYSEARKILPLP